MRNNILNLYLEVAETIMLIIGASGLILGSLLCEGVYFDSAISFMWFSLVALLGGLVCQTLRKLP